MDLNIYQASSRDTEVSQATTCDAEDSQAASRHTHVSVAVPRDQEALHDASCDLNIPPTTSLVSANYTTDTPAWHQAGSGGVSDAYDPEVHLAHLSLMDMFGTSPKLSVICEHLIATLLTTYQHQMTMLDRSIMDRAQKREARLVQIAITRAMLMRYITSYAPPAFQSVSGSGALASVVPALYGISPPNLAVTAWSDAQKVVGPSSQDNVPGSRSGLVSSNAAITTVQNLESPAPVTVERGSDEVENHLAYVTSSSPALDHHVMSKVRPGPSTESAVHGPSGVSSFQGSASYGSASQASASLASASQASTSQASASHGLACHRSESHGSPSQGSVSHGSMSASKGDPAQYKNYRMPQDAKAILEEWYSSNRECPYPDPAKIQELVDRCQQPAYRIKKWLDNRRSADNNTKGFVGRRKKYEYAKP